MKLSAQIFNTVFWVASSYVMCVLLKLGMNAVEAVMMQLTQLVRNPSGWF
jgi:hypothetical protein